MNPPARAPGGASALLRWLVVAVVGLGGAFLVRKAFLSLRARAATRVVLTDFARFEGCLLGAPAPREGDAPDRALALALGTGDPLWPHSCAVHLTRLSHDADDIAPDEPDGDALVAAVTAMDNALGEAVFWTEHVQQGQRPAPTWIAAYVQLRRAIAAFAARHGARLRPAELPRAPRVPRAPEAAAPAPRAVPLPGGTEADLVDATATGTEFAVLLRDHRSRYTVCRLSLAPADAQVRCDPLELPLIVDPRDALFAPSADAPHLALWAPAPRNVRGLLDVASRHVALLGRGFPDARRDYWVANGAALALQIDAQGPELLVARADGTEQDYPLPASLDVIAPGRALVGTTRGASVVWLDARSRSRALLEAVPLAPDAWRPGARTTLAAFREPRLTGVDRGLLACASPQGPAFVAVGDARGAFAFASGDGLRWARGPELPLPLDGGVRVLCDARGFALVRTASQPLLALPCDASSCLPLESVPTTGSADAARAAGALLVADAGGPEGAARVRALEPGAPERLAEFSQPPPPARAVRLLARADTVALVVASAETYLLLSRDRGASFAPAVVAR